jgi:hypothetical protein
MQCIALFRIGIFVDEYLALAFTFMDGPWPVIDRTHLQAIERNISEVAFVNPIKSDATTITVGGVDFKLAGAAVVTIAIPKFESVKFPIDMAHFVLLSI